MKLIASFSAYGFTPVPWSAPSFKRKGPTYPNKALADWQSYVNLCALDHASPRVSTAPIMLDVTFYRRTPKGHKHGEIWSQPVAFNDELDKYTKRGEPTPDLTNLLKGFEDGLGISFYGDDVQVSVSMVKRLYGPRSGVSCRVYEIEPGDFPGEGDPIDV